MSINIVGHWERRNVWETGGGYQYIGNQSKCKTSFLFNFISMNSYVKFHTLAPQSRVCLHNTRIIDLTIYFLFLFLPTLIGKKNSVHNGDTEKTYQSVPSTSNTIPFSGGALWGFAFNGSKGANRFAGPRVASVDMLGIKFSNLCWIRKGRSLHVAGCLISIFGR